MTRLPDHHSFTQAQDLTELAGHHDWSPSWAVRWEEARGTYSEKACLLSIAAEARTKDRDVFCAAYDAATAADPDERESFIAELEALFDEAAEPVGYGLPDEDLLRVETSVWGMVS